MNKLQELLNNATINCMGVYQLDPTKLMHSIIEECIDVVKPTLDHETFADEYLGGVEGLELLQSKVTEIKKRFGIE